MAAVWAPLATTTTRTRTGTASDGSDTVAGSVSAASVDASVLPVPIMRICRCSMAASSGAPKSSRRAAYIVRRMRCGNDEHKTVQHPIASGDGGKRWRRRAARTGTDGRNGQRGQRRPWRRRVDAPHRSPRARSRGTASGLSARTRRRRATSATSAAIGSGVGAAAAGAAGSGPSRGCRLSRARQPAPYANVEIVRAAASGPLHGPGAEAAIGVATCHGGDRPRPRPRSRRWRWWSARASTCGADRADRDRSSSRTDTQQAARRRKGGARLRHQLGGRQRLLNLAPEE